MAKFFVAGCFADNLVVDKDRDIIEKKEGGPAYFIKKVFDELGEDYELAKSKKGDPRSSEQLSILLDPVMKLERRLREIDPETLTPLEALNILYELRRLLGSGKEGT